MTMQTIKLTLLAGLVAFAACGSDSKATPDAAIIHEVDAGTDAPVADCFSGTPTTHEQIINACVDSSVTRIIKHPTLPLLNSDGSLPPLP